MTAPFVAEVVDYPGLIAAIRARIAELGVAVGGVGPGSAGEVAGLADGYLAKLVAPGKWSKRLGMASLGPTLGVLGLKIYLVADDRQTAKMARRLEKRSGSYVRSNVVHVEWSKQHLAEAGRKGAISGHAKRTPKQRQEHARKLAAARWKREPHDG